MMKLKLQKVNELPEVVQLVGSQLVAKLPEVALTSGAC